jgi:hypothetical protein
MKVRDAVLFVWVIALLAGAVAPSKVSAAVLHNVRLGQIHRVGSGLPIPPDVSGAGVFRASHGMRTGHRWNPVRPLSWLRITTRSTMREAGRGPPRVLGIVSASSE